MKKNIHNNFHSLFYARILSLETNLFLEVHTPIQDLRLRRTVQSLMSVGKYPNIFALNAQMILDAFSRQIGLLVIYFCAKGWLYFTYFRGYWRSLLIIYFCCKLDIFSRRKSLIEDERATVMLYRSQRTSSCFW